LFSPGALPTASHAAAQSQDAPAVPMLYGSAPDAPDSQLQAIVEQTVGELGGDWGVAVKKLDTGQYAAFHGDTQQVSASLYKLWVLSELFRQAKAGIVNLEDTSTVTPQDAAYEASLGILRISVGAVVTLREAANLMVKRSDNTTSVLLVRTLGPDNIVRFMQQNGLKNSVLDWYGSGDNLTTPIDVLHVLEMIATSQMVDAESSREMVDMMLGQQFNDLLAPGLPQGGRFAHKTGELDGLLHDAGIVYGPSGPFLIVAMSSNLPSYALARQNMPILMERVYRYFNDRAYLPARYFPETRRTVGHDFLKFYNMYGGLTTFGYPIGPEQVVDGTLVQQFERARMEWHPDLATGAPPAPGVALSPLGQQRANELNLSWPASADTGGGRYFQETGQGIRGGFLEYWLNHGGERIFGLPISPEVALRNPTDGKTYTTQYFQRARMELHPELPDGQRIVLGTLGKELGTRP
jgi:beta-lactamase class A